MSIERDIGRIEAEVKALQQTVARLEPKLDRAVSFIIASKATKRTVVGLASVAGSLGAGIITAAVAAFHHFYKP